MMFLGGQFASSCFHKEGLNAVILGDFVFEGIKVILFKHLVEI